MVEFITSAWAGGCSYAGHIFAGAGIILIAELLWPRSGCRLITRLRGGLFWLAYIAITVPSLLLFNRLWASLGITPLFHLSLSFLGGSGDPVLKVLGGIAAWWLAAQIGEFFYYWFHRAQHASRFLWRFHAVHHALEEMSAFNSNHHFTEELFRIPFITIPLSLLVAVQPGEIPWVWLLLVGAQGVYEHSETRLNFGVLRYLIPDNRYHRIHHSRDPRHFDKNFGSASALWDMVFGTLHAPRTGEWPQVGLAGIGEPASVPDFLGRPFRARPTPDAVPAREPDAIRVNRHAIKPNG